MNEHAQSSPVQHNLLSYVTRKSTLHDKLFEISILRTSLEGTPTIPET
jgi:hypothetical protein